MKMVKKSLIAIAVVALIAATAQAGLGEGAYFDEDDPDISYKEDGKWPHVYIEVDICTIPIYMEVGYYVTIEDCDKLEITLKQVTCASIGEDDDDFPCYEGCVRVDGKSSKEYFKARANFDAIFGAEVEEIGDVLDKTDVYWVDDLKTIDGDGDWHKLTVCVTAWKTDIYEAGPDNELEVGELILNVKPEAYE